ncbi:hypothetical protein ACI2LF_32975 [Kribbella sp. NPDC020789]
MPKNELVDPRARLTITQWPSDAPRGAVTTFCAETEPPRPGDQITITDLDGGILIGHTRPAPGIAYVGNNRPPGSRTDKTQTSPKS